MLTDIKNKIQMNPIHLHAFFNAGTDQNTKETQY